MASPEPAFDVLAITLNLEDVLDGVTPAETHLFAYLSCLLALYRRSPVAEWGYTFTRTEWGTPFATAVADSVDALRACGFLEPGERLRLAEGGRAFVRALMSFGQYASRSECVEAACASALAMPPGEMRDALHAEPGLARASAARGPQPLLDGAAQDALYEHFRMLGEAIGVDVEDLMVPSTVWLAYLAEVRSRELGAADEAGQALVLDESRAAPRLISPAKVTTSDESGASAVSAQPAARGRRPRGRTNA